ncbi:NAD-dependent epimerase/dehydratase family protein [Brevibacterium casei]|uniref:NAD-dependent epimerase/dehydratase family protein n=1 Tax=Brevibacterium casei TaxID=33889 RepID=UPI0021AFADA6|nr:NAD-dependent epimerase/dehydratase family protein [Brevibacterium casei]MCT1549636.1 NAD-dependent epimerase/dehydratase family protein [Brevibacterium casei]MCT1559173.1 NAD-dependent epimerase/dehydratase family protein [Brevibacterium casei]MCT2207601.1 NAD-dependent epimerase/dehydratase family protein [Brevibacterium casei]
MTRQLGSVLVTGAEGFIGSHLVEELIDRGHEVTAVVRRTARNQIDRTFVNLAPTVVTQLKDLLFVDLAGPDAVTVLAASQAQTWFHLAADAYVPASFDQPNSVVRTNVDSTMNVLTAAMRAGAEHVLVTSSSEVYGSHTGLIGEDDMFLPATPYAASKVACDRLAFSYYQTFDLPLTIVRPFNCYGPRHVYDVVPIFLSRALAGEPLIVHGTGEQTRDLNYVHDTVAGFVALAALQGSGAAYNISTGVGTSINELASLVLQVTDADVPILHDSRRAGEVDALVGNPGRIFEATLWRSRWDLANGLQANAEWMIDRSHR